MGVFTLTKKVWVCDSCGVSRETEDTTDPTDVSQISPPTNWRIFNLETPINTLCDVAVCQKCADTYRNHYGDSNNNVRHVVKAYTAMLGLSKKPKLTVDTIVWKKGKYLLVLRSYPPYGWALPGGHVDYGETTEDAAIRELKEETNLQTTKQDMELYKILSDPKRDPRSHVVSIVYAVNQYTGDVQPGDDAKGCDWFTAEQIKNLDMAFDHKSVILEFQEAFGGSI